MEEVGMDVDMVPRSQLFHDGIAIIDWARMAAFIDGEGCISIQTGRDYKSKRRSHWLTVEVSNTDVVLVQWCQTIFGCRVYRLPDSRRSRRPCYRWMVMVHKAAAILAGCRPFFVIKGKQADTGTFFQTLIGAHTTKRLSEDDLSVRDSLRQHIRDLKKPKLEAVLLNGKAVLLNGKVEVSEHVQ